MIIEEAEIYERSITGCRRRLEFKCDSLDNIIIANNDDSFEWFSSTIDFVSSFLLNRI